MTMLVTLCDCGQYPIYPGSDECRICDGSYRLTNNERRESIYRLPKSKAVALAIMCAEEVLPLWKGNNKPAKAIQAAKNWLKNPTERNRQAARYAVRNVRPHGIGINNPAYIARYAAVAATTTAADSPSVHTGGIMYSSSSSMPASWAAAAAYGLVATCVPGDNNIHEKVDRWLYTES